MNHYNNLTWIQKIFCIILLMCLIYSYRSELFYNEVDNIARIIIPIILLIYYFLKFLFSDLKSKDKSTLIKKWTVILFLSFCWVKTFDHYIIPIDLGISVKSMFDSSINLIQAFSIIYIIIEVLSRLVIPSRNNKAAWTDILLYAIPSVIIASLAWLAFYPGIFYKDSIDILTMIQVTNTFTDMHPIAYTMLLQLLMSIWPSPAVAVLFQILLTGFAMGFTGWVLAKIGLSRKYCWIIIFSMAILPVTWIYAITILKDTLYTMSLLIFIDIILLAIIKKDEILGSVKWYLFAFITGLFSMLMRHNGILPIAGTLIISGIVFLILHKKEWAIKTFCAIGATIIFFFGINTVIKISLGENFHRQEASPLLFTQPLHQVVSIYGNHRYQMDSTTLSTIDKYLDLEYVDDCLFGSKSSGWGKGYYFENIHKSADWTQINDNPKEFFNLWGRLVKEYPYTAYIASQRLNSIVWYSNNDGFTTKYISDIYTDEVITKYIQQPILPKIKEFILKILAYIDNIWLLWRPAWTVVLCLILAYMTIIKRKIEGIVIIAPILLNNLGLLIAVPYPDTRFVYINFYALIVFALYTVVTQKEPGIPQMVPNNQSS